MPLVLLNKPFRVLCQFRDPDGRTTLANYVDTPNVYPAGRLDFDSEGLLLLTDDGRLQARISEPRAKTPKTYWAQVEGSPSQAQLETLLRGVDLKDGRARASEAQIIDEPEASLAAAATHSLSRQRAGPLDRGHDQRGPQSPGTPHDGRCRSADVATDSLFRRPVDAGWPHARRDASGG